MTNEETKQALNTMTQAVHEANKKWWVDITKLCPGCVDGRYDKDTCPFCMGTGYLYSERNVGEMLMLVVSELSEALEGHRKNLPDDKLPHRRMFEVELADAIIRIFDICAGKKLDLGGAYVEKMEYNRTRKDHSIEGRLAEGGKKY